MSSTEPTEYELTRAIRSAYLEVSRSPDGMRFDPISQCCNVYLHKPKGPKDRWKYKTEPEEEGDMVDLVFVAWPTQDGKWNIMCHNRLVSVINTEPSQ